MRCRRVTGRGRRDLDQRGDKKEGHDVGGVGCVAKLVPHVLNTRDEGARELNRVRCGVVQGGGVVWCGTWLLFLHSENSAARSSICKLNEADAGFKKKGQHQIK